LAFVTNAEQIGIFEWESAMSRLRRCNLRVSLFLVVLVMTASAQTFTGSVIGHVVDTRQAPIGGASVILWSVERGFERHTKTSADGHYVFVLLPPGKYTVSAEAPGFAVSTADVEVVVATPVRADLILRIQPIKQSVQVFGENGVSVQTQTADLGRTISPMEMSELPSLTRSPYDFVAIVPGAALSNDRTGIGFAVNGARTQSGNYLLDGGENNDAFMSAPAQDVPLDSIEEFNVQTNHFSAEFGRNSGFIANIVTKSGTNTLHGSVYDYIRNSAFAANTYENNAQGLPRAVFNRNQFGGTLGGPILRQKLFFFGSVEPILVRSSTSNLFYVPTPQLLAISAPGTRAIFNRFPLPNTVSTTDVLTRQVCPYGADCETGAGLLTLPAFARTLRTGPQDVGAGVPQNTILATGRLDWVISSKTQAFVRYAFEHQNELAAVLQPYSSKLDVPELGKNQSVVLNLTRTWSPEVATESRVVYSRLFGNPDRFTGINPTLPQPSIPTFSIRNESAVTLPGGTPLFGGPQNTYQFFQTMTWALERHTIRSGGQFVQIRDNRSYGISEIGDATFANTQGFVDAVLAEYQIAIDPKGHFPGDYVDPPFGPPSFTRHYRYNEPALFVQDIWKVRSRVTLTPGLRWEYFGVFHSPGADHPLDANFYPGSGSTYLERIADGQILRTVDAPGPLRGHFYLPDYKNFAPRLGAAYDLFGDGKTVLRTGAGIFYDRRVGFELFRAFQNPPNYSVTTLTNVIATPELVNNQYAVFPDAPLLLNLSDTKAPATNLRTAYTVSWNVTLEREFAGNMVLGLSYLGSNGSQLYSLNNVNRLGSGGLLNPSCIGTRFAADGTTPLGPDYTNCQRLNPNVTTIAIRGNDGHSSFNALQLRLDSRRISKWGLEFGASYTWSHSIDNTSSSPGNDSVATSVGPWFLSAFHPGLDRGASDFDQRQRMAAHWIWEVPLGGKSQAWKGRYLANGWAISGLLSYQTGQPFTIVDSGVPDFTGGEHTRPRVTGVPPRPGALVPDALSPNNFLYLPLNQVYDPSSGLCLANTGPFACEVSVNGPFDDTLGRNTYRRPGTFYQDTAVMKNFPLSNEGITLQFRAEFYNLFNHPNLYVNAGTGDVNAQSFALTAVESVPGVTVSFRDSRQVVLALRLMF
jgi:hypothetical protein